MEGFSKIVYKGKEIFYIDYSSFGFNKEKAIQLLRGATEYYMSNQLPPNSVLALVNVSGLHFDTEVINVFKEEKDKTDPYDKKIAIMGMKGLQKVAYNFIISLTKRDSVKLFDIEQEAKDWLVS